MILHFRRIDIPETINICKNLLIIATNKIASCIFLSRLLKVLFDSFTYFSICFEEFRKFINYRKNIIIILIFLVKKIVDKRIKYIVQDIVKCFYTFSTIIYYDIFSIKKQTLELFKLWNLKDFSLAFDEQKPSRLMIITYTLYKPIALNQHIVYQAFSQRNVCKHEWPNTRARDL